ncbi:MAG: hypothetical protein ACE366_03610 [Bradymonadia bacterium]
MKMFKWLIASALLGASWGCGPVEQQQEGELGKGVFTYRCATAAADLQCDPYTDPTAFPEHMAVGSTMILDYDANEGSTAGVAPASPDFAESQGNGQFKLVKAGQIAFVARAFGEVVDFIHLDVQPIADVVVFDETGERQRTLDLKTGAASELWARVVDARQIRLSGALSYTWSIEHPAVAELSEDEGHGQVTITPKAAGESTVSIEVEGQLFELPLTVTD